MIGGMGDDKVDNRELKRRKLWLWVDTYQLTRQERLDLAQYLLRRDIETWKDLSELQVDRLLDALEGFHLVAEIIHSRPQTNRSSTA